MSEIDGSDKTPSVQQKQRKNAYILAVSLIAITVAVVWMEGGGAGCDGIIDCGNMISNAHADMNLQPGHLLITPVSSLKDSDDVLLVSPYGVHTFKIGTNMYAIVASIDDDGIQIINVTDPYIPKFADSLSGDSSILLDSPNYIDTFTNGTHTYAIVTNYKYDEEPDDSNSGIQIIDVTNPEIPTAASSILDNSITALKGARGVNTFTIVDSGINYMYAIVASQEDNGFQIINVTDPKIPTAAGNGTDGEGGYTELKKAYGVKTFNMTDSNDITSTYAIIASRDDDGFQIINMTDPYTPTAAGSGTDGDVYKVLDGATDVDTFEIGTHMYAIVASARDNGIQIIDVTNPEIPTAASSITYDSTLALEDAYGVDIFYIDDNPYAVVANDVYGSDGGIQIINVTDPKIPTAAGNATGNSGYNDIERARGVDTFSVDGYKYAIVTSLTTNTVTIVRMTDSDSIAPSLRTDPVLNLDSRTLSFNFTETIDVSEINMSSISILDKNDAYITSLDDGSKIKSTDSYKFTITLAGATYRSILAEAASGDNMLNINVTGTAIPDFAENYAEFTAKLDVVMPKPGDLLIIPASSITDNSTLALEDAYGVDIFYIDDNPYAVVASHVGGSDGGIQIINMTDPYYPKALANVTYTVENPTALVDAIGVATFDMDAKKYAIVTSRNSTNSLERGGIQIIDVTDPDAPVVKGNLTDNIANDPVYLGGASGVDTIKIGTDRYAAVASRDDGAIQIINMANPDMPSYAGNIIGGGGDEVLTGSNDVDTFKIGTDRYAIIASIRDDGFRIINMTDPSTLLFAGSGIDNDGTNDSPYTELEGASGVKTFNMTDNNNITSTYAIVASEDDDGFQIVNMTDPYIPSAAGSGTDKRDSNDSLYTELKGAYGVDTFTMTDNNNMTSTYAIVASQKDNGIQIINMTTPLTPSPAGSLSDDHTLVLKESHDVATFEIGCNTYAIATSRGEDGIQIMELIRELTPPVITLLGDNPQTIYLDGAYDELRATTDDGSPVTIDSFGVDDSKVGTYYVTYDSIDPSCNVATQVTRIVKVAVSPITLTPVGSITDGSDGYDVLEGASGVDIFNMTDSNNITSTYAIVASSDDNSFQIINVTDPYHPLPAGSGTDDIGGYTELLGASGVATFEISTDMYAIIASEGDSDLLGGFQIINVTDPYRPLAVGSGTDDIGGYKKLDGANDVDTFKIGTNMYAIIASVRDNGIQIINMTTPSSPSAAGFGSIDPNGASGVDIFTMTIGMETKTYAIIASEGDSDLLGGFQIVDVSNPYRPSPIGSGADGSDGYEELDGASGVKTFSMTDNNNITSTYAIIASEDDDGFQIINMTDPLTPSPTGNGTDGSGYKKLDGASGVDTFKIGTNMYAIIASRGAAMDTTNYGGFQIVDVSNPYRPLAAGSGTDNGSFSASHYTELDGASGVKTFKIGTDTYAIIASKDDDGVQMIRITDSDITSPSLHDMKPDLDLVSGTLTFDFNETIDVSSINATQIEIKDRYYNLITNLNGSKLPSTDSYKFTITLTGAQYRSILVAITNDKEPLEINVGGTAIPDFYSNHAEFTATPEVVMPKSGDLFIIPTGNGADHTDSYPTGYFVLHGASGVDTFEIGTDRYAIIASIRDDGFQIIDVTDPSSPSAAGSGIDNDGTNDSPYPVLDDASGVKTFEIGTDMYAIIASEGDDGFQIINMTDPSSPSAAGSGSGGYTVLDDASDVDIFTVGEGAGKKTYAIVTSPGQNNYSGFQIINMTTPSSPSAAGHGIGYYPKEEKLSETYLGLNFAHGVDTFTIENEDGTTSTYAIIASIGDPPSLLSGGFQIINMTDPYTPSAAGSGTDDSGGYTELLGASDVDTFKIGTDRYAIIASEGNSTLPGGFQIINMTDPYTPSAAGSGTDGSGGYEELDGAIGVETFTRPNDMGEEKTYAIIASEDDDGFQIINITDPYTPSAAGHFSDNPSTLLGTPNAVDTFEIGCHTYAIIASKNNSDSDLRSGFQTVELTSDLTSPVITLFGDNPQTINLGDPYIERYATADDGSKVIPDSSEVNTNVTGTYHVTYDSVDSSCNAATQVRTVNVTFDTTAPTVTSILRQSPLDDPTSDTILTFRITFSEAVKDVNGDDFTTTAGVSITKVELVKGSDSIYDVTVTTTTNYSGIVSLGVAEGHDISDLADNNLDETVSPVYNETFNVGTDNASPTAYAGDTQTVGEGTTVILNGTGSSDPDNDPLTYSWKQDFESGDTIYNVTLSNATQPVATFDAPYVNGNQTLKFTLTVIDPGNLSNSATVTVTILDTDGSGVTNRAPTALVTAVSERAPRMYSLTEKLK